MKIDNLFFTLFKLLKNVILGQIKIRKRVVVVERIEKNGEIELQSH